MIEYDNETICALLSYFFVINRKIAYTVREDVGMNRNPFQTYGALKVTENRLTDLSGNTVQLRGLSTHNLSIYPEYVNEDFLIEARDKWNVDIIRLAMYTAEADGYCVGDDANREKLKEIIKRSIVLTEKLGLYVMVDWHILSDSDPLIYLEQAKEFWYEISLYCKSYQHVLFEICNEPNVEATWKKIQTYADQIVPIIRKNDADKIIIIGTPVWSQRVDEAQADPVTGFDNIMYALHFYADSHRDFLRTLYTQARQKGLPIFVTEFGTMDACGNGAMNAEESNAWLDLLDRDKTSYCIWNLSNKDESSAFFHRDCKKVSGFAQEDLSEQAIWYLERLKK